MKSSQTYNKPNFLCLDYYSRAQSDVLLLDGGASFFHLCAHETTIKIESKQRNLPKLLPIITNKKAR